MMQPQEENVFQDSVGIPFVLMRGGTSKGVFLHAADVEPYADCLDDLLLSIMGSPDPMQIDGLGGTYSSTSKVVIVRAVGDQIHYRFAQVGVERAVVDWSGNCGNLTTAVAPFAIDEGLVPITGGRMQVPLFNENTDVAIEAELFTSNGRAAVKGEQIVPGVPGSGSPITTRYLDPAISGRALPTGRAMDVLVVDGEHIPCSIVAVTHPYVLVDLAVLGGKLAVDEIDGDIALVEKVERIRTAAAHLLEESGLHADGGPGPTWPRIAMVGPGADDADLLARSFSMGRPHRALPMTAAMCISAAARLHGTLVHSHAAVSGASIRIRHPKGVVEVESLLDDKDGVASVGVTRTARRIAAGVVYVDDLTRS